MDSLVARWKESDSLSRSDLVLIFQLNQPQMLDLARYVTRLRMLQVGAGRRKCMDASEIHKFSTWQQVLQRGNPFCDKGGLREQRQSEFCSKRHHGHVKKISPGGSGFSRPSATAQVFLNFNEREYNTLFSLPPFPAQTQARTRTPASKTPPPLLSCRSHSQNPFKHGGRL